MSLTLTEEELYQLTGYRRQAEQLAELHRQGFHRARRARTGAIILERAHYDAVCGGITQPASSHPHRQPSLRRPTLRHA
jgi:hypothetical protein